MAEEKKSRYTDAQNKATQKYIRENLEEIKFRVRKGGKEKYKSAAEQVGLSMAKFFITAADEKIARDAAKRPPEAAGAPAGGGGIPASPETLEAAQEAAERTGEAVADFVARAVSETAERDRLTREGG